MAWNEPDNDDRKDDPWSNGPGGKDQGPPDIEELINNFVKKVSGLFGGRGGGSTGGGGRDGGEAISGGLVVGVLVILAIIWVGAGFYTVDEQERGVVLRFGVAQEAVVLPGLHWNPPLIDEVTLINVTRVYDRDFSNTMLTEDDNIIDITMSVQYIITDARSYFLEVEDPEMSLQHAAESAIRHIVGSSTMDNAITTGREQIAQDTMVRLQDYLNLYGTGITVSQVNIDQSLPPQQVRDAFDDVIKADEDSESFQNQARAYANQVVPESRGNALRQLADANAYKEQVIARADGEAQRFEALLVEYQKAPEVTRERLYLDALQEVMANATKVMIDVEGGGNNMMVLPLDQIMQSRRIPEVNGSFESGSDFQLRNPNNQVPTRTAPVRGSGR
ncbi:MAG: FtsH protease activity modulator HflK [Gammaproteobacteria bacterium]|jgi:modulator of FtsH protease HflK|nr:FtsH protease activity modulator HflK [Gammaproteobacteria bacterium]